MNKISLIVLAAVAMTLQACTVGVSPYVSGSPTRTYYNPYNAYRPYQTYSVGPQYYSTRVPYFGQQVRNYTGTPIVMPSYGPCGQQRSSMIIPNSWN